MALCGALALSLLAGCGRTAPVVEAAGCVSVQFAGKDGAGTAAAAVDEAALGDAVWHAMGLTATPESGTAQADAVQAALDSLTVWAAPADALANGDSVAVEGAVSETKGAGATLTFTPFTVVAEGLDAAEAVDPFSNLTVSWDGCSPAITMLLSQAETTQAPWSWISYTTTENTGLKAGDTVTVTAAADAATLKRLGYTLTRTTMDYTVPDYLGSYLSDWAALDAAGEQSLLTRMELQLSMLRLSYPAGVTLRQAGAEIAPLDGGTFTLSDFAVDSLYFLADKSEARPAEGPGWFNALVCVYTFNLSTDGDAPVPAYGAFALPDITVTSTGTAFQLTDVYHYKTAELDRASLAVDPAGGAYTVTAATFAKAATLETAAQP